MLCVTQDDSSGKRALESALTPRSCVGARVAVMPQQISESLAKNRRWGVSDFV